MKREYILAAVAAVTVSGMSLAQMQQTPDREQPAVGGAAQMGQQPQAGQPQPVQQGQWRQGAMSDSQMGPLTDQQFVQKASSANNFEIQLSQLAERKLDDPQAKQMAKDMLKDHRDAQQKLTKIADKEDIKYSSGVTDPQQKQMLDQLKDKSGDDFKQAFWQTEQQAHQKTIALFQKAQTQVQNQDLKDYAAQTLPKLQEHLTMAQQHQQGAQPAGAQLPGVRPDQGMQNQPNMQQNQPGLQDQTNQQNQPGLDQPNQATPRTGDIPDRPDH